MKKIDKIVIGTHNEGKFKEISDLLPSYIKKISPKKLNLPSPREIGSTFKENSIIKAKFFSEKLNLMCISDDSGLEIDILSGAPGIYSSRWAGPNNNFDIAIQKVFDELSLKNQNWKQEKIISAQFVCCLTIYWPNGKYISKTGFVKGKIAHKKKGINGFGYDPIFIPNNYQETFGEMNSVLKYKIDHRLNAFKKIKKIFI